MKLIFSTLLISALVLTSAAQDAVASSILPPASDTVVQALKDFRMGRERVSVGGSARMEDIQPVHDAFIKMVDVNTVSITDAALITDTAALAYHKEQGKELRSRLNQLADQTPGAQGIVAVALCFRLPRPASETPEQTKALYRRLLAAPELPALLVSDCAGIALEAITRIPSELARENLGLLHELVDKLDPVASVQAASYVERYWDFSGKLNETPEQRETLRLRLVAFLRATLPVVDQSPDAKTKRANIERIVNILDSGVTRGKFIGFAAPEINFIWASRPELKTIADLKGKVVILDFWATWCGPCVTSFPKTKELADLYRDSPVEVVGVTSLQGVVILPGRKPVDCKDDPEKEFLSLKEFQDVQQISWTIAVSREPVFNPEYGVRGIPNVVILAPDGTVRHAGLHPNLSLEEQRKLIDPLLREFGLKVPPA